MPVGALSRRSLLCMAVTFGALCLAGIKRESFRLYEINPQGVDAAALTPSGSQAALIKHHDVLGASGNWDGAYDDLQVWDFPGQKLLLEKQNIWHVSPGQENKRLQWESAFQRSLAYTPDGRELVFCDGMAVHVFDTVNYHELRQFSVTPARTENQEWNVESLRVSPDGQEVAVRLYQSDSNNDAADSVRLMLRVFSLESGSLKREWTFQDSMNGSDRGLSWSPDGTELVTNLISHEQSVGAASIPKNFPDLHVVNATTGQLTSEIITGSPTDTADVAFVGNGVVVTVGAYPGVGFHGRGILRLWSIKTGNLLQEIASPPNGAHDDVQVSQDGHVLLGYAGKSRVVQDYVVYAEQRFRLWDTATWNVLFTSPPIAKPPNVGKDDFSIVAGVAWNFAISQNGRQVMVWRQNIKAPIYLYDLE
jgi:WD40 repeat protein